jgi:predicted PurR-regulated permease PerM
MPRALAILSVYLIFAATVLVLSVRFVPVAATQLTEFTSALPQHIDRIEEWAMKQPLMENYFHQEVEAMRKKGALTKDEESKLVQEQKAAPVEKDHPHKLSPTEKEVVREKVFSTTSHLNDFVVNHIGATFQNLMTLISTTLSGLVYALTGLVLLFYFLLDGRDLKNGFVDILPPDSQQVVDQFLTQVHASMFGFVKGQVLLGIATGIFMIILYSLFDVPYAFFLGAFFAVSEILPVVGTWLGFTPGILVLLFINPLKLLMVMGIVYVYQVIKDNMVAPRVLGHTTGLHPVIVILSLLVCAKIAGLVGVLFAIPIASTINVAITMLREHDEMRDAQQLQAQQMQAE